MAHQQADSDRPSNKRRPDPIDVHVSSRLRGRRLSLGMSQEELGERLGLTFQQIQKYESATSRISAGRLYSLSQALGCSPEYFFCDLQFDPDPASGSTAPGDRVGELMCTHEGIDLCRAFARIKGAGVRKAVITFLRSLDGSEQR